MRPGICRFCRRLIVEDPTNLEWRHVVAMPRTMDDFVGKGWRWCHVTPDSTQHAAPQDGPFVADPLRPFAAVP